MKTIIIRAMEYQNIRALDEDWDGVQELWIYKKVQHFTINDIKQSDFYENREYIDDAVKTLLDNVSNREYKFELLFWEDDDVVKVPSKVLFNLVFDIKNKSIEKNKVYGF